MPCLVYLLGDIFIVFSVLFSSATSSSSFPRNSFTYYLDSDLPSTWYNNNSVSLDSGAKMRVFMLIQDYDRNFGSFCGFYSDGNTDLYSFSVVAVKAREKSHDVVWSTEKGVTVRENASLQLTRDRGLVLREANGTKVWSTDVELVVGMNLTESGNLVLFGDEDVVLWQSFDHPFEKISLSWATRHRKALAGILSAVGVTVIFLIFLCVVILRKNKTYEDIDEQNLKMVSGMPLRFSYETLELATENFKETLGTGGFGSVFKGVLEDGTRIAVKRLEKLSQGVREFLAEVETIGSLHHFNLVRLVGFCAEKSQRLLVYEHMSNGSLDNWIFDRAEDRRHRLDWQTRKKIILGVARGLTYLHEECRSKIIHLDIKPHNILLDDNFNAKVSDFGLSTLIDRDASQVLTKMRGTPGYLAPEWKELRVTVKVDVYSFGVVLLETISKRKNVESSRSEVSFHLLKMLQKKAKENRIVEIVESLDDDMAKNVEEVERMIRIGAWCLQDDPEKRPSMSTVVKAIEGVTEVDPNIRFEFYHAMVASSVSASEKEHVTMAPQDSFLSAPR